MKIYKCEASFPSGHWPTMTTYIRARNGADAGRLFLQQLPFAEKRVQIQEVPQMPGWVLKLEESKRGG
jgi:hypothetical protein